ncbi:ABC transporter ATP-binding protein [Sporosarcina sp. ACRSL]|uniref:ABC transporter ATP-binding protein n=1 Tax=Sporosarcina sp. ACRSL TaxID=2918215 RepID=UPI001EF5E715|nr:ABC transporter ATP-binding protein [Sporosarcina sp. ACRSL]MCG7344327.1 ABC transporter ATP-binding protein [Sporosarcina sp. ACRSL]
MKKSIVKLEQVTKIYEGKVMHRALNRLDFEADQGEFIAIMGPSGSGKTTLLNIISTIDMPTYGRVIIDGIEPEALNSNELALFRRHNFGFVFQDINLLSSLTLEENIVLPLTLDGLPIAEMKKRVEQLAKQLSLKDILNRRPDELSGGQAQRTAVGRALIHKPKLILADEPTGNLDSNSAKEVLELLSVVNQTERTTIIMVTHDPIAASYCDRVLFIKDGEFFNEIYKDERRQTFFQRILNVLSLLGGNVHDLRML